MMIDLHCHLLPGVDDGPEDMAEAVEVCRLAAADGCEVMLATPHQRHPFWWNAEREELGLLLRQLQQAVGERPQLLSGAEIHVDGEVLSEIERLPGGTLFSLAGSRYLLLEFDRRGPTVDPVHLVHELLVAGWLPVIAHPELYPWLMARPVLVDRMAGLGALYQVTAMSLTGGFGEAVARICRDLVDAGHVHFVASDTHDPFRRPPGLSAVYAEIAGRWGDSAARELTFDNPKAVIEDRPLKEALPA
jgi:protein-tyrosine phosphatase